MIATPIFSNIRIKNQLRHSPKSSDSETCYAALRSQSSMPIYHKPSNSSSKLMRNPMVLKYGRKERGLETFINDGPVLILTCFATRSNLVTPLICLSRIRPKHVCVVSVRMPIDFLVQITHKFLVKA